MELELRVDPRKSTLIKVDAQNDFCRNEPGFTLYERSRILGPPYDMSPIAEAADNHLQPFVNRAIQSGAFFVKVHSTYEKGQFADLRELGLELCIEGTPGWESYLSTPKLQDGQSIIIPKTDYGISEEHLRILLGFLQQKGIENALVTGFTTDRCVSKVVANLLEIYDGRIIVLPNCVAADAYKENVHKEKIQEFQEHPRIRVIDSRKVQFTNS